MGVMIKTVGALLNGLPQGFDQLDGAGMTVSEALDQLVARHGEKLASELYKDGGLRAGLAFLVNGRNVLSLPRQFATRLDQGDELIIATLMAGG
jgi:molybdopterin converting factor small subunit